MGHALKIITVVIYGDNEEIILTSVKGIEEFIKEVILQDRKNNHMNDNSTSITAIDEFISKLSL